MRVATTSTTGEHLGLGLQVIKLPCGTFVGHSGSTPGYKAISFLDLEHDRQFVLLANSVTLDDRVGNKNAVRAFDAVATAAACRRGHAQDAETIGTHDITTKETNMTPFVEALPAIRSPPSHLTRRTKFLLTLSLAVAPMAGLLVAFDLTTAHSRRTIARLDGRIDAVDVHLSAGSMRIIATDQQSATIEATERRGLAGPRHSETVKGGKLIIRSSCPLHLISPSCSMDYVVRVPSDVDTTIRGDGANFDLRSIRGDIDTSINGGHVNATFADAPGQIRARANGGRITVELPNNAIAYHVDADADGGSTHVGVRTNPESEHRIDAHVNGGRIVVRYTDATSVRE